jgi:hypothetical protein
MPGLPFVLADKDRIDQFTLLARTRQLFRGLTCGTMPKVLPGPGGASESTALPLVCWGPAGSSTIMRVEFASRSWRGVKARSNRQILRHDDDNWQKSSPAFSSGRSPNGCCGPSISG